MIKKQGYLWCDFMSFYPVFSCNFLLFPPGFKCSIFLPSAVPSPTTIVFCITYTPAKNYCIPHEFFCQKDYAYIANSSVKILPFWKCNIFTKTGPSIVTSKYASTLLQFSNISPPREDDIGVCRWDAILHSFCSQTKKWF